MADKCPVCGNKIGGILGRAEPAPDLIERGKQTGTYAEGICHGCLTKAITDYIEEHPEKIIYDSKQTSSLIEKVLPKIFISPSETPIETQDLGLITGYCILGTGPISTIASSFTDAFGMKSNAYLEKVRLAEADAINMLKSEALKKGGDAVYCCRVTLTEATSGHGMLMVSASGSAVKTGKADKDIEEAWKLFSSLK